LTVMTFFQCGQRLPYREKLVLDGRDQGLQVRNLFGFFGKGFAELLDLVVQG
jgi:hypothetical protein